MDWARILAYITGTVDQELLSRNEYLVTENRILKRQIKGRLLLSDAERATLREIGHRLGRKALADVANAAKPDTILGWYLNRALKSYFVYYNKTRTHLALEKDTPIHRQRCGPNATPIVAIPEVGGLHHRYERLAA